MPSAGGQKAPYGCIGFVFLVVVLVSLYDAAVQLLIFFSNRCHYKPSLPSPDVAEEGCPKGVFVLDHDKGQVEYFFLSRFSKETPNSTVTKEVDRRVVHLPTKMSQISDGLIRRSTVLDWKISRGFFLLAVRNVRTKLMFLMPPKPSSSKH